MKHIQMSVGKKVRELRLEAGLSQENLADKAGIHRSHMGEIERGEVDMPLSTLVRIAQTLEIKASALVRGIV